MSASSYISLNNLGSVCFTMKVVAAGKRSASCLRSREKHIKINTRNIGEML